MKLTWKRDRYSGHWAYGDTYGYQLLREGKTWLLNVREVLETAGVRHTLGQPIHYDLRQRFDTLAEAKTVLQFFEDDPRHDMYEAVREYHRTVTQPKIDAILAEYDARIAH